MTSWGQILTALALVLVLEGMMLALGPDAWKSAARQLIAMPAARLRMIGLGSMLVGALLLAGAR